MLTEVDPLASRRESSSAVHDIFLPDDYPPEWADRYYSEQYLLAAWLLGGGEVARSCCRRTTSASVPELDSPL